MTLIGLVLALASAASAAFTPWIMARGDKRKRPTPAKAKLSEKEKLDIVASMTDRQLQLALQKRQKGAPSAGPSYAVPNDGATPMEEDGTGKSSASDYLPPTALI